MAHGHSVRGVGRSRCRFLPYVEPTANSDTASRSSRVIPCTATALALLYVTASRCGIMHPFGMANPEHLLRPAIITLCHGVLKVSMAQPQARATNSPATATPETNKSVFHPLMAHMAINRPTTGAITTPIARSVFVDRVMVSPLSPLPQSGSWRSRSS